MSVNGVNTNPNTQAYTSTKTQKKNDKGSENIVKGSYNDPDRKPNGLLTKEQVKFLSDIKNDPTTKRLIDNQKMGKDQFMHILLRQLSNQNPLNPMEDKDFIGQMAQFSSLEGMQALNKSFEGLSGDVEEIKSIMGKSNSTDAAILKMTALLEKIAEKIGVDLDGSEKKADTEKGSAKEEVNKETNKQKGEKAYANS